jgi:hypothetical protein
MIIPMFAVDRMDTWVFRVSIAIPLVCFGGLVVWHLVAYLGRKLARKPKTRRQALEPAWPSEPGLHRLPSEQIQAGVAPVLPPGRLEDAQAERMRLAGELLALAREDFNQQHFLSCLERCKELVGNFADLSEGAEANLLAAQIKNDPERLQQVCAALVDALAETYLELAESWLRKGETRQAAASWQLLVRACPETRQAQAARERLRKLGVTGNHS